MLILHLTVTHFADPGLTDRYVLIELCTCTAVPFLVHLAWSSCRFMVKEVALLVSAPILLTCLACLSHCIKSSDGVSAGGRRIDKAS